MGQKAGVVMAGVWTVFIILAVLLFAHCYMRSD